MKHILTALTVASLCSATLAQAPAQPAAPAAHGHGEGGMPGLKKELFEGVNETNFLKLGDKEKSVKITMVAAYSQANYGMNFNGYSHGKATFTVPTGWSVEVTFINPAPVPHSCIVVERDTTTKLQMGEPYFDGGSVEKPAQGMSYGKATFTFTADEAGEYALACGFPAHAISGHWLALNVSDEAKEPTLQLGEAGEAKPATK
jgi:plastocyanin